MPSENEQKSLGERAPGLRWLARLPGQVIGTSPFAGEIKPVRVPAFWSMSGRPTLPFPHPWNYEKPISILESFFWEAEKDTGPGRHTRYLEVVGCLPILVTRDPAIIRAIATETGDKPGQFDRDTLPSVGIARATGMETLLFANGATWKRQKKMSTPPFARGALFQPAQFAEFEETFRRTVKQRLEVFRKHVAESKGPVRVRIEPEVKAVMLEMLTNNFFGAQISYEEIRNRYVPALERVIDHIVRDTVTNRLGVPLSRVPNFSRRIAQAKADFACFDALTDAVIATRKEGKGLWRQFKSDVPDEALRGNIKVFLAGALEATTSYAGWAISHLARNVEAQEKVFEEVKDMEEYTPGQLESAVYLGHVLNETLRLTPSLYFLPRRATVDTWVESTGGQKLWIPKGTHILLDVWHANRHEDHWGVGVTGHKADAFVPERWEGLKEKAGLNDFLHFGFGHGPRFCPGKNLGQMEVALAVGAFVKLFKFKAVSAENPVKAGVSTKPMDGALVELELRNYKSSGVKVGAAAAAPAGRCPFHGR